MSSCPQMQQLVVVYLETLHMMFVMLLSVYISSLKNMPDHGGNRTYELWNTSPMLCQLTTRSGRFDVIRDFETESSSFDINAI